MAVTVGAPFLAFGAFGAACSSFGADDPAPAVDGGNTADAGDAADAAQASDAGIQSDVAAPEKTFCITHRSDPGLVYCNDFERPTDVSSPFGFGQAMITPMVTTISVISFGSHDAVLQVTVNGPGPASREVGLHQDLGLSTGGPLPVRIDFDINIRGSNASSATLAVLHAAGSGCEAALGLGTFDGKTVGRPRKRDAMDLPYDDGVWYHVTTEIMTSATSATGYRELTTFGGMTLVDHDATSSGGAAPTACTSNDLIFGITENGTVAGDTENVTVLYDNILVRKLP